MVLVVTERRQGRRRRPRHLQVRRQLVFVLADRRQSVSQSLLAVLAVPVLRRLQLTEPRYLHANNIALTLACTEVGLYPNSTVFHGRS